MVGPPGWRQRHARSVEGSAGRSVDGLAGRVPRDVCPVLDRPDAVDDQRRGGAGHGEVNGAVLVDLEVVGGDDVGGVLLGGGSDRRVVGRSARSCRLPVLGRLQRREGPLVGDGHRRGADRDRVEQGQPRDGEEQHDAGEPAEDDAALSLERAAAGSRLCGVRVAAARRTASVLEQGNGGQAMPTRSAVGTPP